MESDYQKDMLEIIVVDDASKDKTFDEVLREFPMIKIIRNSKRRFISGSRNIGLINSRGKYIFFIDDDNIIEKKTIRNLVEFMEENPYVGIAVPLTFWYSSPNKIWNDRISDPILPSPLRRRISGRLETPIRIERFDNAFLVRRSVFDNCGMFDEKNFPMHLSEADLYLRIKKKGYLVALVPSGVVWHDVPAYVHRAKQMDEERAFYLLRNRVILARKKSLAFLLFFVVMLLPLLCLYHALVSIKIRSPNYLVAILSGLLDGMKRLRE